MLASSAIRTASRMARTAAPRFNGLRAMATDTIPSDKDQQTGPRKVEMDFVEKYGEEYYLRDSIVPDEGTGTLANPIMIPAEGPSRVIGFECPTTHATFYFTLEKNGMLHYIKQLGLFFMMFDPKDLPDDA
mmetsp:Transcript_23649/g.36492  ORF Transcript_23649/g.36492 Transcript_23649/m.36492 type:complete len:131 (-) Transcript_23649:218-610(-)|eukprot:CAMPEP_0196801692 /NCGR_PEP_ID=MMETSP1362-20130617/1471_1 /TAXON_ID=163516 /ORGANISM="Leptocylindrus danicus, Strain CCMP1856" /LENGTH=130 /DNA_ID=CAMNT_0042172775 /DNA_START=60 /DNA_END=452 /DNA_ORIENTATION=+